MKIRFQKNGLAYYLIPTILYMGTGGGIFKRTIDIHFLKWYIRIILG
jgi:hypothetical protein